MVGLFSRGNSCGYNVNGNNLQQFKYLFFNRPTLGDKVLSRTVCVKQCPTKENATIECFPTRNVTSCSMLESYEGFVFLDAFCVPTRTEILSKIGGTFSGINVQSVMESIFQNKSIFLMCVGVAFGLSFLYSTLLEYCTWIIVVATVVSIFVGGIFLSILSWQHYRKLLAQPTSTDGKEQMISDANFYKWISIAIWILLAILLLVILCLYSRIVLAVHVIMAAGDYVTDASGIVLVPIAMLLTCFIYSSIWIYGLSLIFSTGEVYHNPNYPWGKIRYNEPMK